MVLEASGSFALGRMTAGGSHALGWRQSPAGAATVAVLGSARLGPGRPALARGASLGAALGAAGWAVMTGGYGGLMAATAQGAAEAGAVVIGLPMTAWAGLEPSEHVSELRWSATTPSGWATSSGRTSSSACRAASARLAEATIVWSAAQTEPGAARLVLLGKDWRHLVETFADHLVVGQEDLRLARLADDPSAAAAAVEAAYLDTSETAGPRG